jgi:hypothetical protein
MELAGTQDEATRRQLRMATMRGRPLGSREFVERLEKDLGRKLTPRRPGRPAKKDVALMGQMEIGN